MPNYNVERGFRNGYVGGNVVELTQFHLAIIPEWMVSQKPCVPGIPVVVCPPFSLPAFLQFMVATLSPSLCIQVCLKLML